MRARSLKAELDLLRTQVERSVSPDKAAAAKAALEAQPAEIERLLEELRVIAAEAGGNAEKIVAQHPLASVAAAFLLGVVIGRAMGRT